MVVDQQLRSQGTNLSNGAYTHVDILLSKLLVEALRKGLETVFSCGEGRGCEVSPPGGSGRSDDEGSSSSNLVQPACKKQK